MYYYWAVGCSVGWAVGCCRRIRSKLLCTFYVHLATCKMGRKTRRNDSYIHSGKKRGTFYRTRPTAFTTTQMKQFELSLARIYNLSQDFKFVIYVMWQNTTKSLTNILATFLLLLDARISKIFKKLKYHK